MSYFDTVPASLPQACPNCDPTSPQSGRKILAHSVRRREKIPERAKASRAEAQRRRKTRDGHVSWFFLLLADIMPMPENVPSAPPLSSVTKSHRTVPTPSEFSDLFTILISFLLTTKAAGRMTSSVRGVRVSGGSRKPASAVAPNRRSNHEHCL